MARYLYSRPGHATEFKKKALTPTEPLTLQQLPGWLKQEFGQHGVAIALIDGQQVQYRLHGLADTGQQQAVSGETLFEIGSVSKPLTALAVLSAAAQQHWQLEQPLAQQFPRPELATHQYTLTELLTHRSGLPRLPANLPLDDLRNPYASYHDNELRAALTTTNFTERQFGYSNYGYGLLGWLLATELKQPYAELMQQRVFQPLAMPTAKVQLSLPELAGTSSGLSKLARGYAINGEQVANWQFDSLAGAGATCCSTAARRNTWGASRVCAALNAGGCASPCSSQPAACSASDSSRNSDKRNMQLPSQIELNLFDNYLHSHVNVV